MAKTRRSLTPGLWTYTHQAKGRVHRITFTAPHHPYLVKITVDLAKPSAPVQEISVLASELAPTGVSVRDVRRLPLASYRQAALAIAVGGRKAKEVGEILRLPRGRPSRERKTEFYRDLAKVYTQLLAEGETNPAKEIARRKHVPPNTAHQWVFRARKLGFLDPLPKGEAEK